jgi:arylsulfatase A-like enzyme/Flp pilus assembly protein TadD
VESEVKLAGRSAIKVNASGAKRNSKTSWIFVFFAALAIVTAVPVQGDERSASNSTSADTMRADRSSRSGANPASSSPSSARPNIILITLDTTRADRMGFMGSKLGLTPNLDALAKDSAVFTRAYSQAPLTPASHATILTGTYPQYHQVLNFPMALDKSLPYMPDLLKAEGYSTAAFVGSLALDPTWGVPGFERGFDLYDAGYTWQTYLEKGRYHSVQHRGTEVVAHALSWLDKRPQGPFFMWVHLFDAHDPYDSPEPYKTRYAKHPYDGGVAFEDFAIGKLFRRLHESGLFQNTMIVVTADHGESLGAHGEETHGIFLYDETIHVPLLIKLPHADLAEKRIGDCVELADILPTVFQTLKIPVPKEVQGQSLLGFLQSKTPAGAAAAQAWKGHPAFSQSDYQHLAYHWSVLQSYRTGKYTYVQAPRRELYDETKDSAEVHNVAAESPAITDTLAGDLKKFLGSTTTSREAPKMVLDEAAQEKLAALGYMGSSAENPNIGNPDLGADPKDKIASANEMRRVTFLLESHNCKEAIPAMERLLETNKGIAMLYFHIGGCYMETEQFDKAVAALRKAVEMQPGASASELNLGRALIFTQDYAGAAKIFEDIEARVPNMMDAHVYLEVVYAKLDRVADEIRECRTVLAVEPDHYGGNLNLGRFLAREEKFDEAIPSLEKAAKLRPDDPAPHIFLADVYERLGRETDAKEEREKAISLGAVPKMQGPLAPDAKPADSNH